MSFDPFLLTGLWLVRSDDRLSADRQAIDRVSTYRYS
jgi:hypothetical protein